MKKALVVGIDNYPGSLKLQSCKKDALTIGEIISTNGDGSRNFDVHSELDIHTKSDLKRYIIELFSSNCETAFFYFSGHSLSTALDYYIVTPDFRSFDEGVSIAEILLMANNSKAQNKVIILDCYFASGSNSQALLEYRAPLIGDNVTLISSSRFSENEYNIKGNSTFTSLLSNALLGGAANILGNITPTSVFAFIDQALGLWEQRPVFKANVSQYNSIRSVSPRIPQEIWNKIIEFFPNPEYEFPLNPSFEATNTPSIEHKYIEPYASSENVSKFRILQKLQSVGMIEPVNTPFMYFAALESKTCKLTDLGQHYWQLIKEKRI